MFRVWIAVSGFSNHLLVLQSGRPRESFEAPHSMAGIQRQSSSLVLGLFLLPLLAGACHSSGSSGADAGTPLPPPFDGSAVVYFCDLPGSLQFTDGGVV